LTQVLKVLGQSYSSDRRQPGNPSKNPTSTINYPSTTIPPEKTGNLTEFEKGQIVALKEKSLSFSEIGKILTSAKCKNQFWSTKGGHGPPGPPGPP